MIPNTLGGATDGAPRPVCMLVLMGMRRLEYLLSFCLCSTPAFNGDLLLLLPPQQHVVPKALITLQTIELHNPTMFILILWA